MVHLKLCASASFYLFTAGTLTFFALVLEGSSETSKLNYVSTSHGALQQLQATSRSVRFRAFSHLCRADELLEVLEYRTSKADPNKQLQNTSFESALNAFSRRAGQADLDLLRYLEEKSSAAFNKYSSYKTHKNLDGYWYTDKSGNTRVMGSFSGCQYNSNKNNVFSRVESVTCDPSNSRLSTFSGWRWHYAAVTRPFVRRVCEVGFSGGQSANFYLHANPNVEYVGWDLMNYGYMWAGLDFLVERYGKHRVRVIAGDITQTLGETLSKSDLFQSCDVISIDPPHQELFTRVTTEAFLRHGARRSSNIVIFDGCDRKPVFQHVLLRRSKGQLCGGPGGAFHNKLMGKRGFLTEMDAMGQVGGRIVEGASTLRSAICVASFSG